MTTGILNVLKPCGMTSHDVVGFLRRTLQTKKIGHGGTLDPDAAGVLPVFIGTATSSGSGKLHLGRRSLACHEHRDWKIINEQNRQESVQ